MSKKRKKSRKHKPLLIEWPPFMMAKYRAAVLEKYGQNLRHKNANDEN